MTLKKLQVVGALAGNLDIWATLIEDDRGREMVRHEVYVGFLLL